ncbi:MAG: hypothetical protein AAF721_05230, partial [Myxococcota bacterium]
MLLPIVVALALAPGTIRPDPGGGIVEHGETCPDGSVTARVAEYLGPDATVPLTIATTLQRRDDLWSLEVDIDGSRREFSAPHCATVIDAAAFVIAVTVDPTVADRPTP